MARPSATPATRPGARARSRAEDFAAELEQRISRTRARPGDRLGSLQGLREDSGLARSTVSEAVRLLRDRGLLHIRPGRGGGLFVAEPSAIVRLRHTLLTVRDSPTSVLDAIAVREALEPLICADAARHRSAAQLRRLRDDLGALDDAVAASDAERFVRANWALHRTIAAITPNALARAVYLGALGRLEGTTPGSDDTVGLGAWLGGRRAIHAALVEAIAEGDPAAAAATAVRHSTT